MIDFADMIYNAASRIQARPEKYNERYEHVLVDEFQDIGTGKVELVQALTGPDAVTLFAVGDDWQSIFSFQGAVIDYFTEFAEYFGGDPHRPHEQFPITTARRARWKRGDLEQCKATRQAG